MKMNLWRGTALLVLCSVAGVFRWQVAEEPSPLFSDATRRKGERHIHSLRRSTDTMLGVKMAVLRDVQAHLDWNFKFNLDKEAWAVVTNPLLSRLQKDQKVLRLLHTYCQRAFDHAMTRLTLSPNVPPIPVDLYISRVDKVLTIKHMLHPSLFQTSRPEVEWSGADRTLVRSLLTPKGKSPSSKSIPKPKPQKGPRWSQMNIRFVDNQVRKGLVKEVDDGTEDDEEQEGMEGESEVSPSSSLLSSDEKLPESTRREEQHGERRYKPFWGNPRNQALLLFACMVMGLMVLRLTAGRQQEDAIQRKKLRRQQHASQQRARKMQRMERSEARTQSKYKRAEAPEDFFGISPLRAASLLRSVHRKRVSAADDHKTDRDRDDTPGKVRRCMRPATQKKTIIVEQRVPGFDEVEVNYVGTYLKDETRPRYGLLGD
ncbi:hypothetical protein CSUI_004905 [Cystoisospora suis]|uniref:Transmembrane protein n=1 Tax=Cystoisospora suis TaxID=483139 RepID=A0A2C6KYV8_9APIC|nr:hypothetical protein CSUI_004905 [Cystoisospora suis]